LNSTRQLCYLALVALACCLASGLIALPGHAAEANPSAGVAAGTLTLERFLEQARKGNTGTQGALETSEATELRAHEADLLTSPTAFFNYQYSHDGKPQTVPLFTYTFANTQTASLGVSKATEFGLTARLSTNMVALDYDGASLSPLLSSGLPAGFQITNFGTVNTATMLELNQSLWSGGFGRAIRAQKEAVEAAALATSYGNRFAARTGQADAEGAYWRLATAREAVELTHDNMERARKNYDWSARRAKLQLSDRSDALQSQAQLELRKLDYQHAVDEERSASLAFNAARGVDSDQVAEKLSPISVDRLLAMQAPKRARFRDDVKAAQQSQLAAQAASRSALERDTPTLDVFGTLAANGQDLSLKQAYRQSFSLDHPTAAIGVRFSAPLDIGTALDSRAAYRREEAAADLTYQRKVFEQESQWRDLSSRLIESQRRLKLTRTVEQVQLSKLDHERERYRTGRTTAFQVLTFETDYALSELTRLQAQSDVIAILTQMKLFGDEL
jgi:outer membrane protein TolC